MPLNDLVASPLMADSRRPRAVAQPDGRTADPTAALLGTAAIRSVPVRSGQNTARRTRLEAASLPGIGAQPSDQMVHLVQSYPPPKKKTTLSPVYRGETAAGQRRPFYLTLDPQFLSLRFEVRHTLMGAARSRRGPRSTGFPAPRAMREEPVSDWAYRRSHNREPEGPATWRGRVRRRLLRRESDRQVMPPSAT